MRSIRSARTLIIAVATVSLATVHSFTFSPTSITNTITKRQHVHLTIPTLLGLVEDSNTDVASSSSSLSTKTTVVQEDSSNNNSNKNSICTNSSNILIMDHLNINHDKGRHDWLKAFYVDFLSCSLDPRKLKNVEQGSKTIWVNIGAHQFHLPESSNGAQVWKGEITLVYPNLQAIYERYTTIQPRLAQSRFQVEKESSSNDDPFVLLVTDPWGSHFRLVQGQNEAMQRDPRGAQPGDMSEGWAMRDLTVYTPPDCNLAGIGRFYQQVLGAQVVVQVPLLHDEPTNNANQIQIAIGPQQTLTFRHDTTTSTTTISSHVELRYEETNDNDDATTATDTTTTTPAGTTNLRFPSNYGPHISMYVSDLAATYQRADALGLCYVNPRFSRQAYTLDEALDDCMFRCLNIVDPDNLDQGPILQLEHEIRSVVKPDGSKYKSCPFDEIPLECLR